MRTAPAGAVIDGGNALGVLVARAAIDEACRSAREFGVGVCAVRDSNHFGAAAPLVARAARDGLVALAFSNAAPTMAPWGGRDAILGTNPIAAAFPREGGEPIIVDMATSAVARGRIRQAAARHEAIPRDWALDAEGVPTTDPEAALAGTIQPLGGAKGYALALVVELLCTCLAGGRAGFEVRNPHDPGPEPAGTSHLFVAIDPRRFAGLDAVHHSAEALAARIAASRPAGDTSPPRLPGARGHDEAARRDRFGIPLSPTLIGQLRDAVAALETPDQRA
jgi:LDH2 family malate/lactate/ureidoglycolate dehydrogenase